MAGRFTPRTNQLDILYRFVAKHGVETTAL
jgi:hypothetical protein